MREMLLLIMFASCAFAAGLAASQDPVSGSFETVKAKYFDKEKFVFPGDVRGTKLNIFFLAMGAERESGEAQQLALLEWHLALDERGVFSDAVVPYHFPVLAGVPFFVKGMIVGAMRETYEGKVPLDQAGVLFIDDLKAFADSAGLTIDDQPTIVIVTADAKPLQVFKGNVSSEAVDELVVAIDQLQ